MAWVEPFPSIVKYRSQQVSPPSGHGFTGTTGASIAKEIHRHEIARYDTLVGPHLVRVVTGGTRHYGFCHWYNPPCPEQGCTEGKVENCPGGGGKERGTAQDRDPVPWCGHARGARSPEAWATLAEVTLRSAPDRTDAAESAIAQALRLAPEDASIQELAGRIAYKEGDYTAATARYREAIRLQPGLAAAHTDLAQTYTALGRSQEAQAESESAVRINSAKSSAKSANDGSASSLRLFETRPPRDW